MIDTATVIGALANVIDFDATLAVEAGGEGVFERVTAKDADTLTVEMTDGTVYEIAVKALS